mmetsp:Transcript_55312/g.142442  ORF Transcript_55312/g.142442 Transcript_55312/m.142442 type:complete len:230 (-) Transcript_55312:2068-2757(-)
MSVTLSAMSSRWAPNRQVPMIAKPHITKAKTMKKCTMSEREWCSVAVMWAMRGCAEVAKTMRRKISPKTSMPKASMFSAPAMRRVRSFKTSRNSLFFVATPSLESHSSSRSWPTSSRVCSPELVFSMRISTRKTAAEIWITVSKTIWISSSCLASPSTSRCVHEAMKAKKPCLRESCCSLGLSVWAAPRSFLYVCRVARKLSTTMSSKRALTRPIMTQKACRSVPVRAT